jgi:phenylacetic acid degradation operon negative regulatory protein
MSPSRNTGEALTARSVLASVLLGSDPPWLPTPLLVRTAGLFGISEGTTRTALSRLVAAGEAVPQAGGYRLAGRLVARQARQSASRRADVQPWDGTWELATIADRRRSAADRAALRDALRTRRLVELREGVWGRPDNLDPSRSPEARARVDDWCTRWVGALPDPAPDVRAAFDVESWSTRARDLRGAMRGEQTALDRGDVDALAPGFVTSAAVLRHLQADPLLPTELLPARWPGAALRAEYDRYDAAYRRVLRDWFRTES